MHVQGLVSLGDAAVTLDLARLINAMASTQGGRVYLTQRPDIAVDALLHMLSNDCTPQCHDGGAAHSACSGDSGGGGGGRDSALQQQALAALQKLSLKRRAQSAMLRLGALEWVVGFLCGAVPDPSISSGCPGHSHTPVSDAESAPAASAATDAGGSESSAGACGGALGAVTIASVTAALQQLSEYSLEMGRRC